MSRCRAPGQASPFTRMLQGPTTLPTLLVITLLGSLISLIHVGSAADAVGGSCGGWLPASGASGWKCERLATHYQVYWRPSNDTVEIGLEIEPDSANGVDTVDWFGLGLSEAGGMPGADIALMQRDASAAGGWTLTDMFATGFFQPAVDASQDKTLLSVSESSQGKVRALISFPQQPCDTLQDRAILQGVPNYVIFAFGQGPFGYHGLVNRGNVNLLLVPDPATPPISSSSNTTSGGSPKTKSLTLSMPFITIPNNDSNPYVCMDFKLPGSRRRPYHIIEFSSVINSMPLPGYPQGLYVHHTVLYNCSGMPYRFGKGPYLCPGTPDNCTAFVLLGGSRAGQYSSTSLPQEAGIRIGTGAMEYASLQVHYYNPSLEEGVVDSSGLKITYTSQLRPNDAGLLTTGMQYFTIPPRSTWSTGPLVCPSSCTARFKQPVHMIASLLHMHKLGTQISAQHYTNLVLNTSSSASASSNSSSSSNSSLSSSGVKQWSWSQAEPLATRQYYDFSFQTFDTIPSSASSFSPGDALVTTCSYFNPTDANVSYGLRSTDEMCFVFSLYWPQQELTYCLQTPFFSQQGLVLCTGLNVDHIEAVRELNAALGNPAVTNAQVQAALTQAVEAGVLVPQGDGVGDSAAWVQPQPASCPRS